MFDVQLIRLKSGETWEYCWCKCTYSWLVECVWDLMAQGDAREGKWRGNWRMEWVASPLILPRNVVYPALLTLMRTPRLLEVHWTDASADLNGLVCFDERRKLVSARVPSRFKRTILGFDFQDDRNRTFPFKTFSRCLAAQELAVGTVCCCEEVLCLRVAVSITACSLTAFECAVLYVYP
jgi:hypothetical protein